MAFNSGFKGLILCREIIVVYSKNHGLCGQNAKILSVRADGTFNLPPCCKESEELT